MLTKEEARGAILGYHILHEKTGSGTKENQTVHGKETTSFLVTSLDEFTSYQFSMQAFNSKGVSNESAAVEKTTDEDSKLLYMSIPHLSVYNCNVCEKSRFSLLIACVYIIVIYIFHMSTCSLS